MEWIFGAPPSNDRGRDATALRRSLIAVRPVLARDASAVVVLDRGGATGLVAGVLGRSRRRLSAQLGVARRVRATRSAACSSSTSVRLATAATATAVPSWPAAPADPNKPFALADVEEAVTQVAVSVLQARGEPASAERLLGEVLIGLDQLGHLRRLVATQTFNETEAATDGPDSGQPTAAPRPSQSQADATDEDQRDGEDDYDQAGTPQAIRAAGSNDDEADPTDLAARLGTQLGVLHRSRPSADGHRHG